ncbi:MAG: NIP7 N-terminal domain-related protein [Promethearchaeota archaeon]
MTQLKAFRKINTFEKSIIVNTLSKVVQNSDLLIKNLQKRLYISFDISVTKNLNPSVYLMTSDHTNLIDKFKADLQICSAGLYFGFLKKENFRLSLEGAEYLVKNEDCFKEQILVINSKGEKSILYGNDIYKEDVLKLPTKLRKGELLIIYNSQNEIGAIAQSIVDKKAFKNLNPKSKIALNLVDKGYYLRTNQ